MIEERDEHASVSMGNKLFVIGGYFTSSSEIFDSFLRKFTLIETELPKYDFTLFGLANKVASIGSLIFIITENYNNTTLYVYDVEKNGWSKISCSVLESLTGLPCVKHYIE